MMTLILAAIIPLQEMQTIREVAKEYNLNREQTALLVTIRKIENGRLGGGCELGVGQEQKNHPAKRYKGNPMKSLKLQCQWAAGTIKRRYNGNLDNWSARWCPVNKTNWAKMGRAILPKAMKEV